MLATPSADRPLPTGTVTFLFTDIEGSTKLWEAHPDVMRAVLARHDALVRGAIVRANGYVFSTAGDAFCAAFALAPDAVSSALSAQLALDTEPWPQATPIKVRMALHTGAVESRDGDYFGPALNRVARLLSTGHGGQALLSQTTYELVRDSLPDAVSLHDLGAHKLKDLARPEQVYQLQHPDLIGDFPPIKSLSTHPNNLPQQLTSFIGRETAIAEIRSLWGKTRLLTLTGSGGSGKTRLSLQVAADALEQFPDGAWFVELASLADPGLVPQTVATVLGVKEEVGKVITQTLAEYLKDKRLLLLLDNCEHLLDTCAKMADALIRQCPGVTILASSREALGIAGEQTYRVPSLSLPDRRDVPTPQTLSMYESVQLFIDRALLVRPGFKVTNRNAPALASLCHHVDGIPLAIELAAARVRSLSVEEINGKLDQRFRLLTGGSRTALPRHQTLRALIDWSYDLLHETERMLLQRLSVFAGGWTLAGAEAVAADDEVEKGEILDLLTSLADKSLVSAEPLDGHSRYGLLETVRQYAQDRLRERGDEAEWQVRHLAYFVGLAEEAQPHLTDPNQGLWLDRLESDRDNLRTALAWSATSRGDAVAGLRLAGALQQFWQVRGYQSAGRVHLDALLAAASEGPTAIRAKALNGAGLLAWQQGDYAVARMHFQQTLEIHRKLGNQHGIASSLSNLGILARDQGDYSTARALYEEGLSIQRKSGDKWGIAASLNNLGLVTSDQGDYSAAKALHEECLTLMRELGDRRNIGCSLGNLGEVAAVQADYRSALGFYQEGLAIFRELGDRRGISITLTALGEVAAAQGDFSDARAMLAESLTVKRELGDRRGIAISLEHLAYTRYVSGRPESAAQFWGGAERLREVIQAPLSPTERLEIDNRIAAARAALGDDAAFDHAWQEGRALTLEQAMELALERTIERPNPDRDN